MQVAQWQTSCKGHSDRSRVSGTVTDYVQVAQWQITCKCHSGRSRAAQVCKQVFDNWSHARHCRLGNGEASRAVLSVISTRVQRNSHRVPVVMSWLRSENIFHVFKLIQLTKTLGWWLCFSQIA